MCNLNNFFLISIKRIIQSMFISVALVNIQNDDRSALHIDRVLENSEIQQKQSKNQSKECHSTTW